MTQLELQVHVDEPVDENSAHAIRDVRLGCHAIGTWLVLDLKLAQVLVSILDVLDHVVGLVAIGSVYVEDRDCGSVMTAEDLQSGSQELRFQWCEGQELNGREQSKRQIHFGHCCWHSGAVGKVGAKP